MKHLTTKLKNKETVEKIFGLGVPKFIVEKLKPRYRDVINAH